MDLDADGTLDILSGSWPGELYFFKGKGGKDTGRFAEAVTLTHADGKPIKIDSASTVFAFDWRGTGRLDLLVGSIKGHVYLIPDTATEGPAAFGEPQMLKVGSKEIKVAGGDSHPVVADWANTGVPGLLVGCGDGSVQWYENVGRPHKPKLAPPVTLVGPAERQDPDAPPPKGPVRGYRAKVAAFDWNNDGRLDLLVGDFSSVMGREPKLTKDQIKQRDDIEQQMKDMFAEFQPEIAKMQAKIAKIKDPDKLEAARAKLGAELTERFKPQLKKQQKLYATLAKLQRPRSTHGHVWLYQRNGSAS